MVEANESLETLQALAEDITIQIDDIELYDEGMLQRRITMERPDLTALSEEVGISKLHAIVLQSLLWPYNVRSGSPKTGASGQSDSSTDHTSPITGRQINNELRKPIPFTDSIHILFDYSTYIYHTN